MMKKSLLCFALILGLNLGVIPVGAAPLEKSGTMEIAVTGLAHSEGQVGVNLFLRQEDLFETPYRQVFAKIENGRARLVVPSLPFGVYAVVVFHDENGNGKVDHNFFRFPAEPLGYPSGYRFGLTSGLPTFEKLSLRFHRTMSVQVVVE